MKKGTGYFFAGDWLRRCLAPSRRKSSLSPFFVLLAFSAACGPRQLVGSGVIVTEQRDVETFHGLNASDGVVVTFLSGPTAVTVRGDDNLVAALSTNVVREFLVIEGPADSSFRPSAPIEVFVSNPNLDLIDVTNEAKVTADVLPSTVFDARVSGASELVLSGVSADELRLGVLDTSALTVSGKATVVNAEVRGTGKLVAEPAVATRMVLTMTESAEASVRVTSKIQAVLSGNTGVAVHGNPLVRVVNRRDNAQAEFH